MRIVVAPNSFRDGLASPAVAAAMASGLRRALPRAEVVELPLADGGDGTYEVLVGLLDGRPHRRTVRDPLGRPVEARFAVSADGSTAILEMAEASGLRLLAPEERDPWRASTYGTGELVRAALDLGATRILLGAGGSGTIDGGAGALAALGVVFRDAAGRELAPTPEGLAGLATVDAAGLDPRLGGVRIEVLADIATTVHRHVAVFGPQKGVGPETAPRIERSLRGLFAAAGHGFCDRPWMGAGGCLSGGFTAFAGARVVSGAERLAELAGLSLQLAGADLVLTGEGRLDRSTFEGKLVAVVAEQAARRGIPAVVLAGHVALDPAELPAAVTACFSVAAGPCALEEALAVAPQRLADAAGQIGRLFQAFRGGSRLDPQ